MTKKLILILLIIFSTCIKTVQAEPLSFEFEEIGNIIQEAEYPIDKNVVPIIDANKDEQTFLIEGSVEKSIDITLKECIRFALGNNPKVKVAIEDVVASNSRIAQVWANYFPEFSWATNGSKNRNILFADAISPADATYNYFILGSISVSQMIYDFGVTQNQATIKKLDYAGYKTSLTEVINNVICDTKKAYYNLLYAYDKLKIAQDTVNKFELFYNQAKAFYEIGTNPKVDVTIAEVNLSKAKLDLIKAENNIDLAIAKLNNTMGLPYITRFNVYERLNYQPLTLNLEEVMDIAKESRPDLKLAGIKVEAARQNLQLIKKSYFPELSAKGNFDVGGRTFTSTYGYSYGAYLDFPTINGMKIKNQIKEARALYDREIATAQSTKNDITLEIQNAHITLVEKRNQIPVAFLGVKQAKENYELSHGRYRVGEGSATELKDSHVAYQTAQNTYYQALYEYNSSKADLEKAIGKNLVNEHDIIDLEN